MSKRNIQYVQQDEPSFIKQFKKNIGYKEGPTIDSKREELPQDGSGTDEEDELPTVVVLKKGDISQEEFERMKKTERESVADSREGSTEESEQPADGRIIFKKPTKRSTDSSELNVSSKKKKESSNSASGKKDKKSKVVKNKQLLSFDDEEEEDG